MFFCPSCGTENDDASRFCKQCGRPLDDVRAAAAAKNPPVGAAAADQQGRMLADDGLPVGHDLDGEPGGERLLWSGRPNFLFSPGRWFTRRYRLTNERLQINRGLISRSTEEIDLYRVNDIEVAQGMAGRLFGFGQVNVISTDYSAGQYRLYNVANPDRVKDMIRQAARVERQRRRVLLRDEV